MPRNRSGHSGHAHAIDSGHAHAIERAKVLTPPHAGPYRASLSLTASEMSVIRGALDLAEIDYRARNLPRRNAYIERVGRLIEKIDLAMVDTQSMTTDVEKAIALLKAMSDADRKRLLDLVDDVFCPDCGGLDENHEHEEPCLRLSSDTQRELHDRIWEDEIERASTDDCADRID